MSVCRAQLQAEKTRREEAERQAKELQDRLKAYETEMDDYRNGESGVFEHTSHLSISFAHSLMKLVCCPTGRAK